MNNTNNKEIRRATFTDLTYEGTTKIPTLKITDGKRTGYLTPFRGYRFQVSGNTNGDGDYGSSSVIHYNHLYRTIQSKDQVFSVMISAAIEAVAKWCHTDTLMPDISVTFKDNIFKTFLKDSFIWCIGEESGVY